MSLPFHPLANLFPLIEGREFDELVADVRAHGLREEIVLLDGMILDGRNRYRAALAAGVDPVLMDFNGPLAPRMFAGLDPLAWVLSKNLHRRHLNESQRAMVAARLANLDQGRPSDKPANLPDLPAVKQDQAAQLLHVSERSVRTARQVQEQGAGELVEKVERGEVAVSAAAEVAKLPVTEQLEILRNADPRALARIARERRDLTTSEKKAKREAREAELGRKQQALPEAKFGVIYADPEWRFEVRSERGLDRAADNHYPTSDIEAIKDRDVGSLAADDSVLFLWATVPMLPQALEAMAAWGFAYRSHFVWVKDRMGTGYWNRNEHELLLVGVRGSVPAPAMGEQFGSVIEAPVGAHSEKPDCVYELIEAYFPTLPKIELNARRARPGWARWGYEAPEEMPGAMPPEQPTGEHPGATAHAVAEGETAVDAGEATPAASPAEPGATADTAAIIRQGYAADTPLGELARLTGLTENAVKQRAKRMGLGSRDRQRRMAREFTTRQHAEGVFGRTER